MAEQPVAPTAPVLVPETESGSTLMTPGRDHHVGRDPLGDIVIDDSGVSWNHAVLRAPPDGSYGIADLGSHNGTSLNGTSLNGAAELRPAAAAARARRDAEAGKRP
ncbi:FHA domain-containing protein [Streptomyces sp. cf386]|uniref:FHA domain-containing protein n=1 Tax=Streptomyces sp. cf386 TaxID=1761904 RepID=UPI00088F436A|nr:FHA domain-containing protein [Streptomyces sp. cf386]SDN43620.1 FHA domain-containing protein [Streptomyces sp. cf386]